MSLLSIIDHFPAEALIPVSAVREALREAATNAVAVAADPGGTQPDAGHLNAQEVADLLGVRRARVYSLVSAQKIPHIKLGRQIRFSSKAVQEWLHRQTVASATH